MATEVPTLVLSYAAGEDLSSDQYKAVKFSASKTVVACAAVTDVPCGILQNAPGNAGTAVVMHLGRSKVNSDEALTIGALIGTAADGQLGIKVPGTDTTHYVIGQVSQTSGEASALASALIDGMAPHRAA